MQAILKHLAYLFASQGLGSSCAVPGRLLRMLSKPGT